MEPIFMWYIDSHSLHKNSNDNGLQIIQLAVSQEMFDESRFAWKTTYKKTWAFPDETIFN